MAGRRMAGKARLPGRARRRRIGESAWRPIARFFVAARYRARMRPPASLLRPIGMPRALDRLVKLPAASAWIVVLLCADLAALADLATGPELWFGPVYLLVICLATWALGWKAGQATGIGCMALTFALNGASLYPYGPAELAWNLLSRFVAISTIIAVIAGARRAYVREWWLARTDVLTGALNRQAFFDLGAALSAGTCWRVLLYADLDGLKALNDGRGHAAVRRDPVNRGGGPRREQDGAGVVP